MTSTAVWTPSQDFIQRTRLHQWMQALGESDYETFLERSTNDPRWFAQALEQALGITWDTPYQTALNDAGGIKHPRWYEGGQLNIIRSALERWAADPVQAQRPALIWESEDGQIVEASYGELARRVNNVAQGLVELGVEPGDRVAIYMPLLIETVVALLAVVKLGAIFTPAFSGYAAEALATRLEASGAKLLITADGFLRRGKTIRMKEEADRAAALCPGLEKVVVVRRLGRDIPWNAERDLDFASLESCDGSQCATAVVDSQAPLMLIYTSGTTGKPKGAVHTHSGFPLKAALDVGLCMDVGQNDRLFWITDMGWLTGPVVVFGSLINGACAVLYEGSPDFPQADRVWQIGTRHRATHIGVSPTLVRSLMQHGDAIAQGHDLGALRTFTSTGEPWNPEPWLWLFDTVGNGRYPIINYAGGTEIGGGILTNVLVKPISPVTFNSRMPGMAAQVCDSQGQAVQQALGELAMTQPWIGMTHSFWQEPERYENSYFNRFPDTWVHGDWAIIDAEGFWTITGRSDDTLNVAGKRIGPAEMESILVSHPQVLEAGAIGVPDDIKGEAPVCFVVLHPGVQPSPALDSELRGLIGNRLGKAMAPKHLHFVSELPKTRNGKVMRRVIRAAYLGQDTGDLSSLENTGALGAISRCHLQAA
ncbi:acetyl-CoA synthetase [Geopseudomonas sagittaria]|uniref:acetate--CoA ligase n=1 Tax=Geopseudomonas sagittaria TaxID=1135990 RepID=A0A1I5RAK5_9GAMM|nr:AMP-binding protein [Pseudomonas sagittaria]SFP55552.1 acetyl-CoA synthetase [Pseudomonas sagittaria]